MREIFDSLTGFGDVRRQRRDQIGDQQKRSQLAHRLAGVLQGSHVGAGGGEREQQMTRDDGGDLQERGQSAERERAQDDGQKVEIEERAFGLAREPQNSRDEGQHGP